MKREELGGKNMPTRMRLPDAAAQFLRAAVLGQEDSTAGGSHTLQTQLAGAQLASPQLVRCVHQLRSDPEFRADVIRLLPSLHPVLCALQGQGGGTEELEAEARTARLQCLAANRLATQASAAAVALLRDASIDVLLLKGLALARLLPSAARRIGDGDLLVPVSQWERAARLLVQAGYAAIETIDHTRVDAKHSVTLRRKDGFEIDLHWALNGRLVRPGARRESTREFWERSRPIEWQGHRVRVLDPADQVLHLIVHGAWVESLAPLRWIYDVHAVLRRADVDWRSVHQTAARFRVALQVASAVVEFDRVLPGILNAEAKSKPAARAGIAERLLWWLDSRKLEGRFALAWQRTFRQHLSLHRDRSLGGAIVSYPWSLWRRGLLAPLRVRRWLGRGKST